MFYFIHPTDENFPAPWYRQHLGLSEQQRLNILIEGSHITTFTETSDPSAVKSEGEPRSSLAVHACVWPVHGDVESLLLGGGVNTIEPLGHYSCNCNKGKMKAVWCIAMATEMFSWSRTCSVACAAATCPTDQPASILFPLSGFLNACFFFSPPLQLHCCYWCRYLLISLPECPL